MRQGLHLQLSGEKPARVSSPSKYKFIPVDPLRIGRSVQELSGVGATSKTADGRGDVES